MWNINKNTKTETSVIVETLINFKQCNKYFTNIALNIENNLPKSIENPEKQKNNILLVLVDKTEVHTIIKTCLAKDMWGISNQLLKHFKREFFNLLL